MTNRDVFFQILSEVTGYPKDQVAAILKVFFEKHPAPNFDDEIPEQEAQMLLSKLRKEKSGIRNWLIQGGFMH